ncbi:hypothetical protein HK405_015407, partial [Cladochytrium tenue]
TARALAQHGAAVTLAARSPDKGRAAVDRIKALQPTANVRFRQLDLSSLAAVDRFADDLLLDGEPLHVLIANAGVMACPYAATADGYESQFAVNHLAHFHLARRLLDLLDRSATAQGEPSRVVVLSSIAQVLYGPNEGILFNDIDGKKSYGSYTRYGHSKLANVLFVHELSKRLAAARKNVVTVSVHPGIINSTELYRHSGGFYNTMEQMSQAHLTKLPLLMADKEKTIPQGAATTVVCALDPAVQPGKYYKDCQVSSELHPLAFDDTLSARLWSVSEEMVKTALAKKPNA